MHASVCSIPRGKSARLVSDTPGVGREPLSAFALLSSPSPGYPSDFSPIASMIVHVCPRRPCDSQLGRNRGSDARTLKLEMRTNTREQMLLICFEIENREKYPGMHSYVR